MPESLLKLVPALLADEDVDVQIAACHVVESAKAAGLREPVLQVVATARERWLFSAANNAAWALDARLERLEVLVSRLDEEDMTAQCLEVLTGILESTGGHGRLSSIDAATGRRAKAHWAKFLQEHQEALKAGRRFKLDDPAVPVEDLFPGYEFEGLKKSPRS